MKNRKHELYTQSRNQGWDYVMDHVLIQVWDRAMTQVWGQVRDQICTQVMIQMRGQVRDQVREYNDEKS